MAQLTDMSIVQLSQFTKKVQLHTEDQTLKN